MDNVDKSRRLRQTTLCGKCGETYSVTYKRCPFCGGAPARNVNDIDIQGPELYDQPLVEVRPSVPNPPPPPAGVAVLDGFSLDPDMDFTPELTDETSTVPKPPPGAVGGKRLAGKGQKQAPVKSTEGKPSAPIKSADGKKRAAPTTGGGGALRVVLIVLSLLLVVAAVYIIATKAMPLVNAFLQDREQNSAVDDDPNTDVPAVNAPNFSLTETRVTMTAPGAFKQLIPVYEPVEEIGPLSWSSSDEGVVTVSAEGKLTAVTTGTATITVARFDGTKAMCSVICEWDDESLIDGLTLNRSDFTLRASDPAVQMNLVGVEGTPPKTVWESENPNIAAVSEAGLVTWVSSGSTKITAIINDGALTLTCYVRCR